MLNVKNTDVLAEYLKTKELPDELIQSLSFKIFTKRITFDLTEQVIDIIKETYELGKFDGYWTGYNDKEDNLWK